MVQIIKSKGILIMKKVRLNYKPVASRKPTKISFTVSSTHVNAVDRNIARKIARNELEKKASREVASKYVIR